MAPSLLIVDDHESFRSFVRSMLSSEGFDIAGEAGDGESALAQVAELHPDVVLLDVQLPGPDGIEITHELAKLDRPPLMILTSSRDAADYGSRLASSPAIGFVPKEELSGAALAKLVASA
jgi:DNA-binding NarL/FixJ family response regulator